MEFKEVVEDRYSCKKFNGEPVAEKALKAILEAGHVAPTAKNLQEQRVYVVQSPEKLALIDELTPCRYSPPRCSSLPSTRKTFSPTLAERVIPASKTPPSWLRT